MVATVIITAILLGIVGLAIRSLVRKRAHGGSGCGCGCDGCAAASDCCAPAGIGTEGGAGNDTE